MSKYTHGDGHSETCFWDDGVSADSLEVDKIQRHVEQLSDISHDDMVFVCADICTGGTGCGDKNYWRVVRDGMVAVPFLVKILDDPTPTAATVPLVGGAYTKGDIALIALEEIIHEIPVYELLGISYSPECGVCSYWNFVRANQANRTLLKRKLENWIQANEAHLVWREDNALESVECTDRCPHPAGGYYVAKKP